MVLTRSLPRVSRWCATGVLLAALVAGVGCVDRSVTTADDVPPGSAKTITVRLRDGRRVVLFAGDYRVTGDSARAIAGRGTVANAGEKGDPWEGSIASSEIAAIDYSETSALGTIALFTVVPVALALFIQLVVL